MSSEQDLLEMADDFKKRMEAKNKEINKLKEKLLEARKDFIFSYSEIRNIDIVVHQEEYLIPQEFVDIICDLRSKLSNLIEGYILADVGGLIED